MPLGVNAGGSISSVTEYCLPRIVALSLRVISLWQASLQEIPAQLAYAHIADHRVRW